MTKLAQTDPKFAAEHAAILEGIVSADAGKVIPYEDVRRWLLSWGTEDELPLPEFPQPPAS